MKIFTHTLVVAFCRRLYSSVRLLNPQPPQHSVSKQKMIPTITSRAKAFARGGYIASYLLDETNPLLGALMNSDGTIHISAHRFQAGLTAASVSVGGRITTASGRGIACVFVLMTDANGGMRTAMTNPFGYYQFDKVTAGETYVFTIGAKQFRVASNMQAAPATQVRIVVGDTDDINFVIGN